MSPASLLHSAFESLVTSAPRLNPVRKARASSRTGHPFRATVPISATILTKNSAARLGEVLAALQWCDEIIVLDTGSNDETSLIAKRHRNVQWHRLEGPFPGFGRAHRQAVDLARNDWILSVDSDEVVTPLLAEEISALRLDENTIYAIPFQNYFNGRLITTCGWSPDRHERLFNRRVTNFCESEVHEKVQTTRHSVQCLRYSIQHYSYDSAEDFMRKMGAYSRLFRDQNLGKRPSSPGRAAARSGWAFVKSYFFQRGCLQGYEGFLISAYKAQTVFWKYILLHEANRRRSCA